MITDGSESKLKSGLCFSQKEENREERAPPSERSLPSGAGLAPTRSAPFSLAGVPRVQVLSSELQNQCSCLYTKMSKVFDSRTSHGWGPKEDDPQEYKGSSHLQSTFRISRIRPGTQGRVRVNHLWMQNLRRYPLDHRHLIHLTAHSAPQRTVLNTYSLYSHPFP